MSVFHLSIFLVLLINISVWFPVFCVGSLFLTKWTFNQNLLFLILFLVSQHNLSVISFKPVPVNVNFAPMHVRVNAVRSVSCNLRVSFLAKPMFIYLNTVHFLNVCNAVKSVSSTHHIRRVTHNVISNHRQAFYPKTNALSSSRTKSSPTYSTSNSWFSPFVNSSRNHNIFLNQRNCVYFYDAF